MWNLVDEQRCWAVVALFCFVGLSNKRSWSSSHAYNSFEIIADASATKPTLVLASERQTCSDGSSLLYMGVIVESQLLVHTHSSLHTQRNEGRQTDNTLESY